MKIASKLSRVAVLAVGLLAFAGCCDFEISTRTTPSGTVNVPYSYSLATKCDDANWHLISGQLPPGMGLDLKGRLSGTPSVAGTYTFTLEATSKTNPDTDVISQGFSLVIAAGAPEIARRPHYDSVRARYVK